MEIRNEDAWVMLLSTIRYSMGRTSYMPGLCSDLYDRYRELLTRRQRDQIADEIRSELKLMDNLGKTLGDACDHSTWQCFVAKIQTEKGARIVL